MQRQDSLITLSPPQASALLRKSPDGTIQPHLFLRSAIFHPRQWIPKNLNRIGIGANGLPARINGPAGDIFSHINHVLDGNSPK